LPVKTLFIAPFKDTSGYAQASRNYLKLFKDNKDIYVRAVRYDSGSNSSLDKDLSTSLQSPIPGDISTVVQMLTPNEMRPVLGKRNIAICCWETDKIPKHWVEQLNKFNIIVVPSEHNKVAFTNSGVTKPIEVVPFVFFKEEYDTSNIEPLLIPGVDEKTVVYYNISQWSQKKATDVLIKSYFRAFQRNENVILVLKGYIGMFNQSGDAKKMMNELDSIRKSLRLQNYPRVFISDMMLSDEGIKALHKACHCYVNVSRGEGMGIPAFEALAHGNELISVDHSGMEYVTDKNSYVVQSFQDIVFGMPHPDSNLYTALENWYEPYPLSIVQQLQQHFYTRQKKNNDRFNFKYFDKEKIKQQLLSIFNG